MEEEYIKMMERTVDFIKKVKLTVINYDNQVHVLENKSPKLLEEMRENYKGYLECIDGQIQLFRKHHVWMFADYTLARRFMNVYFSEVESLLDDLHSMEPYSSLVSITLEELASKLDSCKDYILRNGNRKLPF